MNDKYRNHPTVMIQNTLVVLIVFGFMYLSFTKPGNNVPFEIYILTAVIFVALEVIVVLSWKLTTITFEKDQVVVENNLLYKRRKTIPYSKIASANVVRNIFNRLFGTTTLQININSAQNAALPEAGFVFKKDLADKLRADLMSGIFQQEFDAAEEEKYESVLKFKGSDAVLYGIIGGPTVNFLNSIFWSAFSIISLIYSSSGGFMLSFLMLIVSGIIPIVGLILKYFNFKVYRVDNNIRLQHGMIQTYRTSFDVARINAIRVRRPLFARFCHKCCIEAEVVGINAAANETTPMICLLIKEDQLDAAMKELLPEFIRDIPMHNEPKTAKFPLISKTTYASIAWLLIMAYPLWWFYNDMTYSAEIPTYVMEAIKTALPIITVAVIAALYWGAYVSFKRHEFGLGDDMFKMVNGIVDRETVTIQYDRVQISKVFDTPMPRRFGLSRVDVSLLSSAGAKTIRSGYFDTDELSKISEIMLERLADGKYDYTKTTV